jgi:hypothetical protein
MTRKQIRQILDSLGPAVKGSVVEVRKPCIRPGCPACRAGRKHRAFMFHYAQAGKRRCMYVPVALVGTLRKALRNGRLIEQCLHEAGPELIRGWRKHKDRSA